MTSAHPAESGLADAVRAGAAGLYSLEAACDLVIGAGWLHRDDFAASSPPAPPSPTASPNSPISTGRPSSAAAMAGSFPATAGRTGSCGWQPASPNGIPVDLNDALCGLDRSRISLVVRAVRHANGQRPAGHADS
jgi:hypothetical protein